MRPPTVKTQAQSTRTSIENRQSRQPPLVRALSPLNLPKMEEIAFDALREVIARGAQPVIGPVREILAHAPSYVRIAQMDVRDFKAHAAQKMTGIA